MSITYQILEELLCYSYLYYENQIDIQITISAVDNKYAPAVIPPVLFSRDFMFLQEFSTKNSCGRSSIPKISKFVNKFK